MRSFSVREMVWVLTVVVSEVHILSKFIKLGASLEPQMVKNLPAGQETQVRSRGQEDPLEKEMATHSSILAEEFHGQRSLADYSPPGHKELDISEHHFHFLVVEWLRLHAPTAEGAGSTPC